MATILIVDDGRTSREYLATILEETGHRLLQAADGAGALAVAKSERPDLLISDVIMPTMDGYEMLRRLRDDSDLGHIPVIFYTAHFHEKEGLDLANACGVSRVIAKGCEPQEVLGAVEAALRWAPERPSAPGAQEFNREHQRLLTDKLSEKVTESGRLYAELRRHADELEKEVKERQRTEEALRKSEELFRNAFEHTDVAMVVTDLDHRFLRANAAFARMFGHTPAEILELSMPAITHPDDLAESYAGRETLLAGSRSFFQLEKRYRHKDGRLVWGLTNVSLIRDAQGRPFQYVGQLQDITERKQAAELLQQSEARYRSVVEGSLQGLLIKQGPRIEYANPACLRMFGYTSAEEFVGQPWEMIVAPEDLAVLWQRAEACVRGESVGPHSGWQGVRKDGKRIWLESMISPVSWQGKPAVLAFLLDITERKQLEDQYRQAQKMEAIGRLAGGVAHDFNNLLTVINGYSGLIVQDLHEDDPHRSLLEEVHKAGERAALLTRQLLAFSRKQVLQPTVLDLNALLANMEKMLGRLIGEDVDLVIHPTDKPWRVKADVGQLEQVVMNLAVNARDAMPTGGKLTIETANVELDGSYVSVHPEAHMGQHVLLAVTDTGVGMDAATRSRMFEPFFTTKGDKGTGLGLATVFGIIKQSGGHVEVYSEQGLGTSLKVYLPREREGITELAPNNECGTAPCGHETVLVTEDEEAVRNLTRMTLEAQGYKVLVARNGAEAISTSDEHSGSIHLLVTDVVMPNMGGRQVAERLKAARPGVKVLYLSGYTDDAVVRHGVLEAESSFLQKPFATKALARKVREVLDQK